MQAHKESVTLQQQKPLKRTTMKKNLFTLALALFATMTMNAMDYETARERAYYLTDKMAYELNLNDQQYNDAFEINLDYLLSLNTEADLADARYLSYRNDDLRHILYDWQWTTFAAASYLFRPVVWLSGGWHFPIYRYYAHNYYFYNRPSIFWNYRGGHGRFYYTGGFYLNRRPVWHGGLRGMHHHMVGHPNPGGGRYGRPGGGPGRHDTRGGISRRHDAAPGHHGNSRGYHFERNGSHANGNTGRHSAGNNTHNNLDHHRNGSSHSSDAHIGGSRSGSSYNPGNHNHSAGSASSHSRGSIGSSRSGSSHGHGNVAGSRSGGSISSSSRSSVSHGSFSGGSRSGGSFSGGSRGGSSHSGGRSGGSSRGGGRR